MNPAESIAHIQRRQEEVRRFSDEMRAASAKDVQSLSPLPLFFAGMIGGALCFFAGMTTMRLLV